VTGDDARRRDNLLKKVRTIRNQAVHLHNETNPQLKVVEIDYRQNAPDRRPVWQRVGKLVRSSQRTTTLQILSLLELLARSNKRGRIRRAPGSLLGTISEFLFSKKTLEEIVNPTIADLQMEYCEALAARRPYKAAWVRVRGYWSFAKAIGLYGIVKAAYELWRKVST
jgi:hypothetical protein